MNLYYAIHFNLSSNKICAHTAIRYKYYVLRHAMLCYAWYGMSNRHSIKFKTIEIQDGQKSKTFRSCINEKNLSLLSTYYRTDAIDCGEQRTINGGKERKLYMMRFWMVECSSNKTGIERDRQTIDLIYEYIPYTWGIFYFHFFLSKRNGFYTCALFSYCRQESIRKQFNKFSFFSMQQTKKGPIGRIHTIACMDVWSMVKILLK